MIKNAIMRIVSMILEIATIMMVKMMVMTIATELLLAVEVGLTIQL